MSCKLQTTLPTLPQQPTRRKEQKYPPSCNREQQVGHSVRLHVIGCVLSDVSEGNVRNNQGYPINLPFSRVHTFCLLPTFSRQLF